MRKAAAVAVVARATECRAFANPRRSEIKFVSFAAKRTVEPHFRPGGDRAQIRPLGFKAAVEGVPCVLTGEDHLTHVHPLGPGLNAIGPVWRPRDYARSRPVCHRTARC